MNISNFSRIKILGLILVAAASQPVVAQRPGVETDFASLLSRSCEKTGEGNLFENASGNVSIGRRIYEYSSVIAPGRSSSPFLLTCRINEKGSRAPFGTLSLEIGHEDSSGDLSEISFYLDGNSVGSYTLREGEIRTILFDVADIESFAMEAVVGDTGNQNVNRLYIIDDTLLPLN